MYEDPWQEELHRTLADPEWSAWVAETLAEAGNDEEQKTQARVQYLTTAQAILDSYANDGSVLASRLAIDLDKFLVEMTQN